MRNLITISKNGQTSGNIYLDRNVSDLIKFIACIMVALSHYGGYYLVTISSQNIFWKVVAANFGYIGVASFFFLSGYGLAKSDQNSNRTFASFLKRRISKVYIPAVLVSAIWLIFNLLLFGYANPNNLLCNQKYLLGVLWLFNDEVMWFVRTILFLYLCFYIYTHISKLLVESRAFILLLLLAVLSTSLVAYLNLGDPISVPLFWVGIFIVRFPSYLKNCLRLKWVFWIIIVSIVAIYYFIVPNNRILHGTINYVVIYVLIVVLSNWNISITKLPGWIGSYSYDLYLVHYKVHLLLVLFLGVDKFIYFLCGTFFASALFNRFRKLLHL